MHKSIKVIIVVMVGFCVLGTVIGVVVAAALLKQGNVAPPPEASSLATDSALERIKKHGELRVITDSGTPPWSGNPPMLMMDGSGQFDGFDYRMAKAIAAAAGVEKVKLIHSAYTDFTQTLLKDKEADMVIGGFIPYDVPGVAWSKSYLDFGLCLIVTSDSPIHSTADLWGKKIAVYPDEASADAVSRLVKGFAELQRVESGYFDLLLTKKIDAFIYDFPFAVAEIQTHYARFPHQAGKLKIAQYNLTNSTYNVAVRSGEKDLLALVDQAIATWQDSPGYAESMRSFLPKVGAMEALASNAGGRVHVVAVGETLRSIATAEMGKGEKWKELWEANKFRMPNPNLLEVGDQLVIP